MELRLFIIAIIPAVICLSAVYLADREDREPLKLLLLTYLLGAITVLPAIVIEEFLIRFNVFSGSVQVFFNAFIVAAFTEEFLKRLVVVRLPYRTKYFDEKLDGIVYAVFASMGFATVENIIYVVFTYSNNAFIGLYRGIFSVPAHAIFGITMGYYLSLARFHTDKKKKRNNYIKSLIMPILFHGTFNFLLMSEVPELTMLFIPYVIYLWWSNARKLGKFVFDSKHKISHRKKE